MILNVDQINKATKSKSKPFVYICILPLRNVSNFTLSQNYFFFKLHAALHVNTKICLQSSSFKKKS